MNEQRLKELEELLKGPPQTNIELGKRLGVHERTVRKYKAVLKKAEATKISAIEGTRQKRFISELKARCAFLEKALEQKDAEILKYAALSKSSKTIDISTHGVAENEAVPVIVASDWHIEESVSSAITNGLNAYNIDIATDSVKQFFSKACDHIEKVKRDHTVHTVVLAILGDIINGVLRNEDLENNQMTSIDALATARSFLYSGIKLLEVQTNCKQRIICCVGNHGRMTEKIHFSNQIHNSLEYLMYKTLERDFRDHPDVSFIVSEAPYVIQSIFGVKVRFQHGHNIKFLGGIGGLAVPVLRKVSQMNMIEKADLDVIGHFHSFQCLPNVIINGSLVGTNGYSMALGLPHERPQQTFFLIDKQYGKSMISPIFIDRSITKETVTAL